VLKIMILPQIAQIAKLGVPSVAFLNEKFLAKKISDNFPTTKNLGDNCSSPNKPTTSVTGVLKVILIFNV